MSFDYTQVGGKLYVPASSTGQRFLSGRTVWDFGWIPPEDRTEEQEAAHAEAEAEMSEFKVVGDTRYGDDKKVWLTDLWSHKAVADAIGFAFPGIRQVTGSCVGAGGGNVEFTTMAVEVLRKGDPELICVPFWLLPYGMSRYYLGERGEGEGSSGGTLAKALLRDGLIPANTPGLPAFENNNMLVWGQRAEMTWSNGAAIAKRWLDLSRKHLFKTAARCKSADDVREAVCNGYACTGASMWGCEHPKVEGTPPVLVGRRDTQWSHQESVQAWMLHPQLGELFYYMNQWGKNAHGKCPSGITPGGMWLPKKEMDWICKTGEVYAYSQFDGFPAQDIPKLLFKVI